MRGPLTTMVEVNRIEETKAEMSIGLRLLLLGASEQDPGGAPDDVLTEPLAPEAWAAAPAGAGKIPGTGNSAKQKDAWGTYYAYCAWNNGSDHAAIGTILSGGTSTNNIAVALISAGPDRQFQTTCQANSGGNVITPQDGGGDDILRKYNYNDAVAGSDGLWALQAGAEGDEARIEEEINVGGGASAVSTFEGGASFGSNIQTEGNVNTDVIGPVPSGTQDFVEFTHGIQLGDTATCSNGMLRVHSGKLELCLGGAWNEVGKALWVEDSNGMRNDDALAAHVGIGVGSSAAYGLFVNGGTATDVLKATSTVDFDATLNVDGAVTLKSTAGIDGAATLGSTLEVAGDTDLNGKLDVANTTDMHGDLTVNSDVFIKKTGGTKGNLSVEDAITATEGDITATAGDVVATAGDVIATAGNVEATAGNVTAGDSMTAQNNITATTGDITATAGDVVVTAGNVVALGAGGKIVGKSFHRGSDSALDFSDIEACDPETEKTVWSGVSGWGCEPDNGTGTGTGGESTLEDVLGRGNDAGGQNAEDFGKIGADEYCDAGLASCVSAGELVAGSTIWKKDGPGGPAEIYYNGGNVGIGTNDPLSLLTVAGSSGTSAVHVSGESLLVIRNEATAPQVGGFIDLRKSLADNRIRLAYQDNYGDGTGHGFAIITDPDGGSYSALPRLVVMGTGEVGVGTTNPKTRLDIAGTLKVAAGTEACTDSDADDHRGAVRFVAADNAFEVCADESVGWEDLFNSGDAGGVWKPDDGGKNFIEYDDALGGMRVGMVAGDPPVDGWRVDAANSIIFTNGKVGANEYCAPDGTNCFDPAAWGSMTASLFWKNDGPGGTSKIYYGGGNVGIGTNDPSEGYPGYADTTLDVRGEGIFRGRLTLTGYEQDPVAGERVWAIDNYKNASGNNTFRIITSSAIMTNGFAPVVIEPSGKVGIGMTFGVPAKTALELGGSLKIGNGTELCNSVDHEGAIRYVGASDKFEMCRIFSVGWEELGAGGDSLWSDSGNGYIEYSVADAGVKLRNIAGLSQPALALAPGVTWQQSANTLHVSGDITYEGMATDISDRRLKTDIEKLIGRGSMLKKLGEIDTYAFRMKSRPDAAKEFGVMAQELEKVFPELVRTANDAMATKSVNYIGLVAPLIEATKELGRENEKLVAENAALGARVEAMESQVALLNSIVIEVKSERADSSRLWLAMVVLAGIGALVLVFTSKNSRGNDKI